MEKIKILELFGGIGAPRKALENLGYQVESDYVEIDNNAVKSYNAMYGENFNSSDIRDYHTNRKFDICIYGSSCTGFSRAGKSDGGSKGSNTQSSLIWEAVRIVNECKPKIAILENVTDIVNKSHIETFNDYIEEMKKIGYDTKYFTINSRGFYTPQTRKRVFVIHSLEKNNFDFKNIKNPNKLMNSDEIIFANDNYNYIGEEMKLKYGDFTNTNSKTSKLGYFGKDYLDKRVYQIGAELPTITASNMYKVHDGKGIRELTSLELLQLMGFTEEDYNKIKNKVSESAIKKQAGNSIVVPVLEEIFKELLK